MPAPAAPTVDDLLGAVISTMPSGVERPGQHRMAHAVAEAIAADENLLVQAGTGTGKSLGYLIPALHSGKRTVVATATLALQAQLVEHDLPKLVETLAPHLGRTPEFALLKGRHHYACRSKLDGGGAEDSLFESGGQQWVGEISRFGTQVKRVREWASDSITGDRTELDPGVDDLVWRGLSMSARECIGATRCAFGDECFAEAARERARSADVIVTNHTLLAIDMISGHTILPPHELLVIDEAHELAGHVTNAARAELSPESVRRMGRGLRSLVDTGVRDAFDGAAEELEVALPLIPAGRLLNLPPALSGALSVLAAASRSAVEAIGQISTTDEQAVAKNQHKQALRELTDTVQRLLDESEQDVAWIDEDSRGRRTLVVAPLSVAGLLAMHAFADRTVVATSATLTLGGRFDQVAGSFGLKREHGRIGDEPRRAQPTKPGEGGAAATDKTPNSEPSGRNSSEDSEASPTPQPAEAIYWHGLDVGSPFDYPRQGILYVARRLPRPGMSGLPETAATELMELVQAAGGRTLGLFSSRKAAGEAAEILRAKTDLPVLLQGDDTLGHLVRDFRSDPRTCLFGVMSLWQGVDVPGPACQLVVIDRLPFPRPDDPLSSARAKAAEDAGRSGFLSVSVPHAAVRLAQGAGRLIRSAADKGVVAVLDSRLHHASYGEYLRRSLPPFWHTTDSATATSALGRLDTAAAEREQ